MLTWQTCCYDKRLQRDTCKFYDDHKLFLIYVEDGYGGFFPHVIFGSPACSFFLISVGVYFSWPSLFTDRLFSLQSPSSAGDKI